MLLGLMLVMHKPLRLPRRQIPMMIVAAILMALSSLLLFEAYNYMDVGIASTLLFVYPVMVAIINTIFYRERLSAVTISAIAMATAGIMLLYEGDGTATLNITGTALVLLAALSYSIYGGRQPHKPMQSRVDGAYVLFRRDRHSGIHCRHGMERIHSSDRCAGLDMCAVAGTVPHHNIACYNGNRHPQYRLDSDSYTWRTRACDGPRNRVCVFGERLSFGACVGIVLVVGSVTMLIAARPAARLVKQFIHSHHFHLLHHNHTAG